MISTVAAGRFLRPGTVSTLALSVFQLGRNSRYFRSRKESVVICCTLLVRTITNSVTLTEFSNKKPSPHK